ncbi:VWA domain-containing protein [Myxococcota bacterium]|nr:VWA domain-containing protein [Myxococcota bacterium]
MRASRRRFAVVRPVSPTLSLTLTATLGLFATACIAEPNGVTGPAGGEETPAPAPATPRADEKWPGGSLGGFVSDGTLSTREVAGSGSGGGGPASADGMAEAGAAGPGLAEGERDDVGADPGVGPAPPVQEGGLEGGEIDDNADFEAFLAYLERADAAVGADPMVHHVDVSTRHLITVRDAAGDTVPDATVRLLIDDDTRVTWGRTRADGRFAFFPGAYDASADKYLVQVERAGLTASATLRADDATLEIALPEDLEPAAPRLDVAFVIDCTGSMGEEIGRIKATITEIAGRIAADESHPDLRFGLVAYRDMGDAFVTRAVDFTDDVQAFQGAIDGLQANGGGDFPEALNEALHETMRGLAWRQDDALRLTFVVADAPAHHYEQAPYTYDRAMLDAATMGVKVFPVASGGSDPVAELQFRQLAQFSLGHFVFITEGGGSSEGSGGSDYDVDPQQFRVEALDDLIVRLVTTELDAFTGR